MDRETQQLHANVELEDGQGNVWARVAGWTEYVWNCSDAYIDCTELPHRHAWAAELELPGAAEGSVCTAMTRDDLRGVNLDWTARLFLHEIEMPEYLALDQDKHRRQQFLASRVAAKDAIRLWWSRHYGTEELPHPSLFVIAHDDAGRPYLLPGDGEEMPHISLAHTAAGAVAIVADVPVGIDLESAERDVRAILPDFATAAEIELVAELTAVDDDNNAALRLWCVKEAMAKALGTGLQGRPKDFEAIAVENGDFLVQHGSTGERLVVHTVQAGPFLIACTAVVELLVRSAGTHGKQSGRRA